MRNFSQIVETDHKTFSDATVKARLGWVDSNGELLFPKLDIDCFADDDSRLVVDNYENYLPTEPTEPWDQYRFQRNTSLDVLDG